MSNNVKEILKAVAVLACIALVSGILLGVLYPLTRLTEQEKLDRIAKQFESVYPSDEGYEGITFDNTEDPDNQADYLFKVKGEESTYLVVATGSGGYGGDVTMIVVIQDGVIIKIGAGTNSETSGISDPAFSDKNYAQYIGTNVSDVKSFKLDKELATGATRSATAINNAVNIAVNYFNAFNGNASSGDDDVEEEIVVDYSIDSIVVDGDAITYVITQQGTYEYSGDDHYIQLEVTITNNEITAMAILDHDFTDSFITKIDLDALYVGQTIKDEYDGASGDELVTGTTGASTAIAKAMNVIVKNYNVYIVAIDYLADVYQTANDVNFVDFVSIKAKGDMMFKVSGEDTYIIMATSSKGYNGNVTMFTVIKDGEILQVVEGANTETNGISDPAFSDESLAQYVGVVAKDVEEVTLNTDENTGATYSATAINETVNIAIAHYNAYISRLNGDNDGFTVDSVTLDGDNKVCTITQIGTYEYSGDDHYLQLEVTIDKDNKITAIEILDHDFTASYVNKMDLETLYVGKVLEGSFDGASGDEVVTGSTGASTTVSDALNTLYNYNKLGGLA